MGLFEELGSSFYHRYLEVSSKDIFVRLWQSYEISNIMNSLPLWIESFNNQQKKKNFLEILKNLQIKS
jgi:hypothetical protein